MASSTPDVINNVDILGDKGFEDKESKDYTKPSFRDLENPL